MLNSRKGGWKILKDKLFYIKAHELTHDSATKNKSNNIGNGTTNPLYCEDNKYFTCVPNIFIQEKLKKDFGLNRIFISTYIEIDRRRSREGIVYLTIDYILKKCGYRLTRNKPKIFYEVIKSLLFLKENNFIDCDFDPYSVNYNDCIRIKIIKENFDCKESFTKVYHKDVDYIMTAETYLNRENILVVFLYIISYIGCRKNNDGAIPSNNPEAFWKSINNMASDLSMSKATISQCLDFLTTTPSNSQNALLIKHEVGSIKQGDKPPQNVANIYVLNKEGYENEIIWALQKMKDIYNVEEFNKPTKIKKEN